MTSVRLSIRNKHCFTVEHPGVHACHPSGRLTAQQKILSVIGSLQLCIVLICLESSSVLLYFTVHIALCEMDFFI